jgi:hypothetical protein
MRDEFLVSCIVAAIIFVSTAAAAPIDCQTRKPAGAREYWAWRIIDGRQCWYAGERRIDKNKLRWSEDRGRPAEQLAPVVNQSVAPAPAPAATKDQARFEPIAAIEAAEPEPAEELPVLSIAAAQLPAAPPTSPFPLIEPPLETMSGLANFGLRQITIILALVIASMLCFFAAVIYSVALQFEPNEEERA